MSERTEALVARDLAAVWHPFTQHAERTSPVEQESKETTERSHRA